MTAELTHELSVETEDWHRWIPEIEPLLRRALDAAWQVAGFDGPAEVSVVLSDDARMRRLNHAHRGQDSATNVLAFPMGEAAFPDGPVHLGDVVLSLETLLSEAARDSKSIEAHVSHLAVHGILHLLGHDHGTAKEAAEMEALEVRALKHLGYSNPYQIPADAAE
jgi:probable rRNA maturation factor